MEKEIMIEKQVLFFNIIGRGEAFSKHRFQVGWWKSPCIQMEF